MSIAPHAIAARPAFILIDVGFCDRSPQQPHQKLVNQDEGRYGE